MCMAQCIGGEWTLTLLVAIVNLTAEVLTGFSPLPEEPTLDTQQETHAMLLFSDTFAITYAMLLAVDQKFSILDRAR